MKIEHKNRKNVFERAESRYHKKEDKEKYENKEKQKNQRVRQQ